MIYYTTIVDISGETGISKWDFIHPDTPKNLYDHLKGVRDYIPSMTYGIVSVVSKDLFGDRLRRMEFQDMQIVIGKLSHGNQEFYVFFLCDIKDHPKAVWKSFMDFYREERDLFNRILTEEIIESADIERLRTAFSAFLVNRYRKNPLLGARDNRSLIVMLLISFAIMSAFVFVSWVINHMYHLIDRQESWLKYTAMILLFHFALPGPIFGYITRYRRHAEIICIANGLIWALIISTVWYETLRIGIYNSFHVEVNVWIFYAFVLISGAIYGATLMLLTVPSATFFERRYLTTPRIFSISAKVSRQEIVGETEQMPEENEELPATMEPVDSEEG